MTAEDETMDRFPFSDESVGQMLRQLAVVSEGQRKCEEQNAAIHAELSTVQSRLDDMHSLSQKLDQDLQRAHEERSDLAKAQRVDDQDRADRVQTRKVLKAIGGLCVVLVLPLVGFLGKAAWDHYFTRGEELHELQRDQQSTESIVVAHVAAEGHEPLRARVRTLETTASETTAKLGGMQLQISRIEQGQDLLLDRAGITRPPRTDE